MTLVAGLDIGSRLAKAVIVDENDQIKGKAVIRTRVDFPAVAQDVLEAACEDAGVSRDDIDYVSTTGFGRYNVPFRDIQITEITCGAKGAHHLFPGTRSVLDIGFQSTRAIGVRENGRVREFKTNDKCAAGAGGFLERAAKYLEVTDLADIGRLSAQAQDAQTISSVCAVLGETEIINHMSSGQLVENILAGIHASLADRAKALLKRAGTQPELTFISGVAQQEGAVKAVEKALAMPVNVPEDPQIVCALGAALLGMQRVKRARQTAETQATA